MRVAVYVRKMPGIPAGKQSDGCFSCARAHEFRFVQGYGDDCPVEKGREMVGDAMLGEFDSVVVWSPEIFSDEAGALLLRQLEECGIEVAFVQKSVTGYRNQGE